MTVNKTDESVKKIIIKLNLIVFVFFNIFHPKFISFTILIIYYHDLFESFEYSTVYLDIN